jgi:signal transduction histidine kinase/ActR/RegA family two-component response regulator
MTSHQSIALRLEIERVNLLYRQNMTSLLGVVVFASCYVFVCGSLMVQPLLSIWIGAQVLLCILRLMTSFKWKTRKTKINTMEEARAWHMNVHALIGVSGILWGVAAWIGAHSPDFTQQTIAAITVIFMSAGAIVCWSPSLRPLFAFLIPAMVPWALSYVMSSNSDYHIVGYMGLFLIAVGSRSGMLLNHYINQALKLTIENAELAIELKQEILVKDRAEESLRLALASSNAIEWRWDVENDIFTCKGDLEHAFGLQTNYLTGTLDEVASLFYHDDQEKFRAALLKAALKGSGFESELRVSWPDSQVRDLAIRGQALKSIEGKTVQLTGIAWDTTAQNSQAKLQKEKDIHEAANKAKSIFLANASHEIRTPLAAINGYADTLLKGLGEDSALSADLQVISRNGKFLTSLVNDFLDLSKIESGQFYFQKGIISPFQEIEESLQFVKPTVQEKGLHLEVHYADSVPATIESDPARFRQILINLLSNATKFTSVGFIKIMVQHQITNESEGLFTIRVIDSGIGIDDRTKKQLFEPFWRGQSQEAQRTQGAGLGLALSRNLSQLLGGNLKLVWSVPGKGSEFEFSIRTVLTSASASSHPPEIKKQANGLLHDFKILVVDDAVDLRVLMRRNLEKLGAHVDTCENGLEAVEKALAHPYNVILMDIKMPVMDGYEATSVLRNKGYNLPIVAVTAHASVDDKQKILSAGCNYYLSKPVDLPFLTDIILKSQTAQQPHN